MEKTGCKIIGGAPTTLAVKGLMMMMMYPLTHSLARSLTFSFTLVHPLRTLSIDHFTLVSPLNACLKVSCVFVTFAWVSIQELPQVLVKVVFSRVIGAFQRPFFLFPEAVFRTRMYVASHVR